MVFCFFFFFFYQSPPPPPPPSPRDRLHLLERRIVKEVGASISRPWADLSLLDNDPCIYSPWSTEPAVSEDIRDVMIQGYYVQDHFAQHPLRSCFKFCEDFSKISKFLSFCIVQISNSEQERQIRNWSELEVRSDQNQVQLNKFHYCFLWLFLPLPLPHRWIPLWNIWPPAWWHVRCGAWQPFWGRALWKQHRLHQ